MDNPGPIAVQAAKDAEANVGVTEQGGNNRGKYVEIYQASCGAEPGDPWCACFVSYRLQTAAKELGLSLPLHFPLSAWTPDYPEWARSNGLWLSADRWSLSQRGDLCCYWMDHLDRIGHIGIVVHGSQNPYISVEGNTSKPGGVTRDGDGVWEKQRQWTALGTFGGFVRLPF